MPTQARTYLTPEQYLSMERTSDHKSEYWRGEIFAMAGASPIHALIVSNIVAALHGQLRRSACNVYASDLRVKIQASGLYTHPDVIAACGTLQFDGDHRDTLLNPTLIVEVRSESTQDCDWGGKFAQYRKIPAFAEYVHVAQDEYHEENLLTEHLRLSGYTQAQISVALYRLRTEADNHSRGLYGNNKAVYDLLRYGVPVKVEAGQVTETVNLINWQEPEQNDFAIAEEVTLKGNRERRPDVVLYVNGIATAVLEMKNSRVSIGDGIRQSLSNQRPEFNA